MVREYVGNKEKGVARGHCYVASEFSSHRDHVLKKIDPTANLHIGLHSTLIVQVRVSGLAGGIFSLTEAVRTLEILGESFALGHATISCTQQHLFRRFTNSEIFLDYFFSSRFQTLRADMDGLMSSATTLTSQAFPCFKRYKASIPYH